MQFGKFANCDDIFVKTKIFGKYFTNVLLKMEPNLTPSPQKRFFCVTKYLQNPRVQ